MISVRAEVNDLLALITAVRADLAARGEVVAAAYPAAVGVMIEVPAAALTVAELAAGLDFVSVGTNDLTQYAMAADRINPALAALQDAAAPGVVALLRAVVDGAKKAGVEVGVCGELAGSVAGARLLTEIGIYELSMDPAAVDEVREGLIGA
jgi:phosphoenolpyruvate-protein kinase (PTS system EI component)